MKDSASAQSTALIALLCALVLGAHPWSVLAGSSLHPQPKGKYKVMPPICWVDATVPSPWAA